MELHYRKAEIADTELLTKTRIMVLRAVHSLPEDANLDDLTVQSRRYYQRALRDGTHTAYLVYDGDRLVGAGGVSYFEVLPTYHNPTGQKAYIMNVYTDPACRRRATPWTCWSGTPEAGASPPFLWTPQPWAGLCTRPMAS